MHAETFTFAGFGGVKLPAILWLPDGEPRRILQIARGTLCWMSTESARRMRRFG